MIKKLLFFCLANICVPVFAQDLPAVFEHDRISLVVQAPDGTALKFYTDTGGGWNAIRKTAAEALKLEKEGEAESDGGSVSLVEFPDFLVRAGVPRPSVDRWLGGQLAVVDDSKLDEEGLLGSRWFAGHVWRIDYPNKKFSLLSGWRPSAESQPVPLGFRQGVDGKRKLDFPRITIVVDGDSLEVLLDTGATAQLTENSAQVLGLENGSRIAASYIVKSIFDQWHVRHPDWKVIDKGEAVTGDTYPMIEVPRVNIASITVGPVWFAQRPDAAFHDFMSQMMDKRIDGALGGSALKYLDVVLDYPQAKAWLHKNATTRSGVR